MVSQAAVTLTRDSIPAPSVHRYTVNNSQHGSITVVPVTVPLDDEERAYVGRLWAEDWDSPEDAIYDD